MATVALQGNRHILQYYIAWDTCGASRQRAFLMLQGRPWHAFRAPTRLLEA